MFFFVKAVGELLSVMMLCFHATYAVTIVIGFHTSDGLKSSLHGSKVYHNVVS